MPQPPSVGVSTPLAWCAGKLQSARDPFRRGHAIARLLCLRDSTLKRTPRSVRWKLEQIAFAGVDGSPYRSLHYLVRLYAPDGQWYVLQKARNTGGTYRILGSHGRPGRYHKLLERLHDVLAAAEAALHDPEIAQIIYLTFGGAAAPPDLDMRVFLKNLTYLRKKADARLAESRRLVQSRKERSAQERPHRGPTADPWRRKLIDGIGELLSAVEIITFNSGKPTAVYVAVVVCCLRAARPEETVSRSEIRRQLARYERAKHLPRLVRARGSKED